MSGLNWGELVADAGDAGNSKYENLPDGDYDVKVVDASHTLTAKGKVMFKVKLQVLTGPYANRFLWDNLVVSPESKAALGIFFRQMKALGLDQEYFNRAPTNDQVASSITGVAVRVKVGHRPYNGEDRNEIKAYNAVNAGGGGGAFPGQQQQNQPPVPQGQPQPPQQPQQAVENPWGPAPTQQGGFPPAPPTPF